MKIRGEGENVKMGNQLISNVFKALGHPTRIQIIKLLRKGELCVCDILPNIDSLLGLLDVWVQRETMIKLMGEKSGFIGISLAFILGSAAAGPLYAAFPIAGVLLKKGSKFSNVLIFIGAWSTTKIPLLLFEVTSMGWKFMLTRFIIDIPGIALIAYTTDKLLSSKEKQYIYDNAVLMEKHS